jgi:hypothetical protein
MSSRFHNKYHRHNHHTQAINDPRYPDASHDPIASPESPFLGPFVLIGPLSAIAVAPENQLINFGLSSAPPAGVFIAPATSAVAIQTVGGIEIGGSLTTTDINFTGNIVNAYSTPLIANGDFLQVTINGTPRYIRLWNFY